MATPQGIRDISSLTRIEPVPPVVETWILSQWTASEVQSIVVPLCYRSLRGPKDKTQSGMNNCQIPVWPCTKWTSVRRTESNVTDITKLGHKREKEKKIQ